MFKTDRKPKQDFWDNTDPNYKAYIQPPTRHTGKRLIHDLEKEEAAKMQEKKQFRMPDVRPGDIIQVYSYASLADQKLQTVK